MSELQVMTNTSNEKQIQSMLSAALFAASAYEAGELGAADLDFENQIPAGGYQEIAKSMEVSSIVAKNDGEEIRISLNAASSLSAPKPDAGPKI